MEKFPRFFFLFARRQYVTRRNGFGLCFSFAPRSVGTAGVEKRSGRQVVRELPEVREQRADADEHVTKAGAQENLRRARVYLPSGRSFGARSRAVAASRTRKGPITNNVVVRTTLGRIASDGRTVVAIIIACSVVLPNTLPHPRPPPTVVFFPNVRRVLRIQGRGGYVAESFSILVSPRPVQPSKFAIIIILSSCKF